MRLYLTVDAPRVAKPEFQGRTATVCWKFIEMRLAFAHLADISKRRMFKFFRNMALVWSH